MKASVLVAWVAIAASAAARAEPPSAAARTNAAAVTQRARAGDWDGALPSANRVVAEAPDWAEGYFLRAGILVHQLPPGSDPTTLANADPSASDAALAKALAAPAADLRRYLALATDAPDRERVAKTATALESAAQIANSLAQRYTQQLADAAEDARRKAEEAAERARIRRHHEHMRHVGSALALLGLGSAVASVGLAVDGTGRYDTPRMGGFATGADIDAEINLGRTEVTGSYVTAGAGFVLIIAGLVTVAHNGDDP